MSITDPPPNSSIHHITCGCTQSVCELNKIASISTVKFAPKASKNDYAVELIHLIHVLMWSVLCSLCWRMVCTNGRIVTEEHALLSLRSPQLTRIPLPEHMGCVKCQIKTDGSAITPRSLIMSPYCAAKFTSARL